MMRWRLCGLVVVGGMALSGLAMALPSPDPVSPMEEREQAPPAAPDASAAPSQGGGASTKTVDGEPVKFCPVGGESYPAEITYCPEHGVELKPKS